MAARKRTDEQPKREPVRVEKTMTVPAPKLDLRRGNEYVDDAAREALAEAHPRRTCELTGWTLDVGQTLTVYFVMVV